MFARVFRASAFTAQPFPVSVRVFWLLAFFSVALSGGWAAVGNTQTGAANQSQTKVAPLVTLELGKPIERELAGGQSQAYQVRVTTGQYFHVEVEQIGIDIDLSLSDVGKVKLTQETGALGKYGVKSVWWIAELPGGYTVEVRAMEQTATAGRYKLRVSEVRQPTLIDENLIEAQKLFNAASVLDDTNKYDEALVEGQKALSIREKVLGPEHPIVALSLNQLAHLHSYKGDYLSAKSLHERALIIREKSLGSAHPDVAKSLSNLAKIYSALADYSATEQLYQRALTIFERAFGPNHSYVASTLDSLANCYEDKGDFLLAESLHRRALEIQEKMLGTEHPEVATILNNMGVMYYFLGNYKFAESHHKRALAIWENALGIEHTNVAYSLRNLANVYRDIGDYKSAEPLYKRALNIQEKVLGPDHPDIAYPLNELANLYKNKQDHFMAESLYKRALAISEKTLGAEHYDLTASLDGLAALSIVKQDFAAAEQHYKRSLAICEKTFTPSSPDVANSLNNLATLYWLNGKYAAAEVLNKRALAIREKALGPEHLKVAMSLNNLGLVHKAAGNFTTAAAFFGHVLSICEGHLRRNLFGSERQQQAFLKTFDEIINTALVLHPQSAPNEPQARQLALTALLRFKGRGLDESTDTLNRLRSRADKDTQPLLNQLFSTRSQYSALTLRGPDERTLETYRSRLEQLGQEIERLEADLSQRSLEFRATTLPITPEAVTAAIPANTALVEFVQYHPVEAKTAKQLPPHYVVYVLTAQGEPRWAELGVAAAIDQQVEALRLSLRNPKRSDYQKLARRLDQQVMAPVRKLLGDKTQLLLSPDGMLNLLPFAALVDESGKYLMERYKLTYLSSGRDLLRMQIKQQARTEALVLANPDFEQPLTGATTLAANTADTDRDIVKQHGATVSKLSESVSMEQVSFRPLPGTAGEAAALRTLLPAAQVLTEGTATESALKQIRRPWLLHIATHGYFLKDLVLPQIKQNDNNAPRLPEKTAEGEKIENPLLRSGLALAGANRRKSGDDDGILTALEAAGLDLWGTKLVVLSACDTGVGEIKNGDGVYGLRRAFVLAGSESQVMSMWSVSDQATRDLMIAYYKRLLRGEGRGEALRQVQLQMLKQPNRRHPYYWASFIQSGEWANLDGKR